MNRYTALTLLACSITLTAGATEPVAESDSIMIAADTVAVIENPNRIIVTESSASTTIEVNGTQHRPDYHFSYSINADTTAVAPFSFTLPIIGDKLSHPPHHKSRSSQASILARSSPIIRLTPYAHRGNTVST